MKTKHLFTPVMPAIMAACLSISAAAAQQPDQQPYTFNHGPYIQALTQTEATIFFTTSDRGYSRVEARRKGSADSRLYHTVRAGLIDAWNTGNKIKVDGLEPATDYEYRLISKRMLGFEPYKVTYGDSIASPWYGFRTIDPAATEFSFMEVSDIHDDAAKFRALMSHMPMDSVQMVFLNGDIMSYIRSAEQPYTSFIDAAVDVFAKHKPFVVVRGNHETRGNLAREYLDYVHVPGGNFYGLYRIGDTAVIMIDSGEDKPDTHSVYAGIVAFEDYRLEQAEWLKEIVKTKEFTSARHRIVITHIPPMQRRVREGQPQRPPTESDPGTTLRMYDTFVPILNRAGIDLMICGHTHRRSFAEAGTGGYGFPLLVNDNRSASFVHVSPAGIYLRTMDTEGNTVFTRTLPAVRR